MKPICLNCQKEIIGRKQRKFCTNSCQSAHTQSNCVKLWLERKLVGHAGAVMNIKKFVRDYIIRKYGEKCCKCDWCIPHPKTGKPPLEINHIDGDASNTWEDNLEPLCPNCHSLTMTYKNYNKNNGKRNR